MKKRVYFNKTGDMIYISHLDMLRLVERIFRKAGIKLKHSQGFTPRPKISMATPISLGEEAYNEPMDIEFLNELSGEEILNSMNENSPKGLEFTAIEDVDKKSNIAVEFSTVIYRISAEKDVLDKLEELYSKDEIIEERKKRGKLQRRDLKPRIKKFERYLDSIEMELEAMSPKALFKFIGLEATEYHMTRLGYRR
jgi:radical SAM-linked protein